MRRKGLLVDLVIFNEERSGLSPKFTDQITSLINSAGSTEHNGGIFVRVAEQVPVKDRILLQTVARIELSDNRGH